MRSLISGFVPGRGLGLAAAGAVLVSFAAFSGVTPARAQENNNMFNSVLGFFGMSEKDQDAIDYRPRAPIVVPPRKDLSPPKAAAHDPSWPNDADAAAQRRALLNSRRPAPQTTAKGETSQTELQQGNIAVPVEGPPDECEAGGGTLCLATPWKFVKSMVNGFHSENAQLGPEPDRKYLIEPPPGYRKATGVAKAATDAPKDQPDTADHGSSIKSQSQNAGR